MIKATPELWILIRTWLDKQKHISKRVRLEILEYGPPYAELCTVGNRYTWANVFENRIEFYTETDAMVEKHPVTRQEVVLTLYAHDKEFFKKMKNQLWKMLYAGNLNWPMP